MNNSTSQDHREFSRVGVTIQAKVHTPEEEIVSRSAHDVSMKGMFMKGRADWAIGTECEIHLILEGREPPVHIQVRGRVQRKTEEGMALLFTEVGLEAYEHLHNLVLLNSEDPEKTEQEFKSHVGLKKK